MTKISNLPRDVVEEVLCRIPLTSLRKVRSTCKKWNRLSKAASFARRHLHQAKVAAGKEFMVAMMMDFRVYLMSVNLHKNKVESCMNRISLGGSDQIDVCQVFHCDGLLLCISKDNTRLVVWNPYVGQIRCIEPTHNFQRLDRYVYALGYDKSPKILRFINFPRPAFVELKIYDFNSDSWRVLDDVFSDWQIPYYSRGVSLRGNTYWFAKEKYSPTREYEETFLVCFDFARESFGPRLPLPFVPDREDTVTLSSVREEQLAVLFQQWDTLLLQIWVTTKIEPNAVSWNTKVFLSVNMGPLTCFGFQFLKSAASFFIDEDKKVAVVFDKDFENMDYHTRNVPYIVGADGTLKEAHLGVEGTSAIKNCFPLVCSYAPSSVQL